ncbi:MAG: hypothetical protein HY901_09855 [Deltaproteobacteria bacterium]|nr:hypothetical protein [Deltaproteobacteria bacterium]
MTFRSIVPLLAVLAPAVALAADATPPPAESRAPAPVATAAAAEPSDPSWSATATAREEYRFRQATGPSESDHTARLALDLEALSPGESLAVRGAAGLWWRFIENYSQPNALASPRSPFWLDVYQLGLDWKGKGLLQNVKAGRLEADFGQPATFDGAALVLRPLPKLRLFAFGGRSVHFFEVDQGLFEDWMASAGVEVRSSNNWKLVVDYRLLTEDVETIRDGSASAKVGVVNNTYGLASWHRFGDWLNVRFRLRGIDEAIALAGVAFRAEWIAQQLGVDARIDVQPSTLRELNEFDDPFFLVLGQSKPHLKARVSLFKNFATSSAGTYSINLGGDARQLIGGAEESAFNRNLLRGYLLLSAQRVGGTGLFAQATGEIDRVADGKGSFALGGALGWDQKPVRAEVGTAWYRYKYVYYQSPEEISDVRELYGDVNVKVLDWLALRARYSYEVFDRKLHTVTFSITEAL